METVALVLIVITVLASLGHVFQLWVRHQRRVMIHRERLAAIEKGTELPPIEQEIQRSNWNVQRLLLLAGMVWMSVGIAAFPLLTQIAGRPFRIPWGYDNTGNPAWPTVEVPMGMQWIAVALVLIGVSHLIVYVIGRQRERDELRKS